MQGMFCFQGVEPLPSGAIAYWSHCLVEPLPIGAIAY